MQVRYAALHEACSIRLEGLIAIKKPCLSAQPAETSELMERLEDCQMTLGSMATNRYRCAKKQVSCEQATRSGPPRTASQRRLSAAAGFVVR